MDSVLNYPMYNTINDVFGRKQSMYGIKNRYIEEYGIFKDVEALGLFVDNHDNNRFLNLFNGAQTRYKSALAFALTERGIPIVYYGSEQGFGGGRDPLNREQLWTNMDQSNHIYRMIATINKYRKQFKLGTADYVEAYVDDTFYAYKRGEVLMTITN